MLLEFGPVWEAILPGDLKLRFGQGRGGARTDQVLGLITKMSEIWAFGKLHGRNPFQCPVSACSGERRFAQNEVWKVGLLPFPRTGCVPHADPMVAPDVSR